MSHFLEPSTLTCLKTNGTVTRMNSLPSPTTGRLLALFLPVLLAAGCAAQPTRIPPVTGATAPAANAQAANPAAPAAELHATATTAAERASPTHAESVSLDDATTPGGASTSHATTIRPDQPTDGGHDTLAQRIDSFIGQSRFRHATWGIKVVDAATGRIRYAHNADKLFIPASNAKLYTAALALHELGPNRRFTTTLLARARGHLGGVLKGDLILRGGGDPSLGDTAVAPQTGNWADVLAQAVANMGIERVQGDLVADVTRFHGATYGTGWEANDLLARYAAPVSPLVVDGNTMGIRVFRDGTRCCRVNVVPEVLRDDVINVTGKHGSDPAAPLVVMRRPGDPSIRVGGTLKPGRDSRYFSQAVSQPARLALLILRRALANHGVSVTGQLRIRRWPAAAPGQQGRTIVLATISSPPLYQLVHHLLKHSDNLYAQTLLLQVGVEAQAAGACADRSYPPVTTEGWGLCALRAMLRVAGIPRSEATFTEGSGLSRHDLVTPDANTRLLRWARQQAFAPDFIDALPIAGQPGTLHWRLRHLPPGTSLRAKTGSLTHVYALSGYVTDVHGEELMFSIMLNRYQRPRDAMGKRLKPSPNDDLDAVARMIVGTQ